MATEAMDINTDPGYCMTMDPSMALGSSSGLDVIMAPNGNIGHPDQHGPPVAAGPLGNNMATDAARTLGVLAAFGGNMGCRCQHRP